MRPMQRTNLFHVIVSARLGSWEATFVTSRPPNVGILREAIQCHMGRLTKEVATEEDADGYDENHDAQEWVEQIEEKIHGMEACRAVIDSHRSNVQLGHKNVDVAGTTVGSINVTKTEAFVDGR